MKEGKRNHTGHRVGAWHGRAKYNDQTVQMARYARSLGMSYSAIGRQLGGVPWRTVVDWCNYDTRWSELTHCREGIVE